MAVNTTIPAETRGIVRRWKAALAISSDPIYTAGDIPGVMNALDAVAHKKGVGRTRAIKKIHQKLPAARLWMLGPNYSVWAFLAPCDPLLAEPEDEGEKQAAVSVAYLFGGSVLDRFTVRVGQWSLEIPDHALHRLAQRAPGCDLSKAVWDAHTNVLAAEAIRPLPEYAESFYLPAGDGVFVGQFVYGHDKFDRDRGRPKNESFLFYFRARTWLHQDQLRDDQAVLRPGKPGMGENELLPNGLRQAAFDKFGHLLDAV